MAVWRIYPKTKKSLIERLFWKKEDNVFVEETCWRGGEFLITTEDDTPPILESGVDLYCCGYDCETLETFDGCWCEYDMSDCDDETKEWLTKFLEENSTYELEDRDWHQTDAEMIIDCEIEIERYDQ